MTGPGIALPEPELAAADPAAWYERRLAEDQAPRRRRVGQGRDERLRPSLTLDQGDDRMVGDLSTLRRLHEGGVRLALPYNASLGLEGSRTLRAVAGSDVGKKASKFFVTAGIRF